VEALGRVLATQGAADDIVPVLTSALGLPDAARAHLLGWADLADDPDAVTAQPAKSTAAAIGSAVLGQGRADALARSPLRRLFGAVVGAAFIVVMALLAVLLVPEYLDGSLRWSWWDAVPLLIALAALPVAALAVWNWWKLRGAGQSGQATPRRESDLPAIDRWLNRRGPGTALWLVFAVALAAIGVLEWQDTGSLRAHGVQTTATVLSVTEDAVELEFQLPDGQLTTVSVEPPDEFKPGDLVAVVYDPADPGHVRLAEVVHDDLIYIFLGIGAAVSLTLAALTWWRVIDVQKLTDWQY
jgi:hypothetical protein